MLHDDTFRGPGTSLGFAEGQNTIRLAQPLENLDDVTLLLTLKMPHVDAKTSPGWNKGPLFPQRLFIFGEAPDGRRCGAERYEIFLSPEMAGVERHRPPRLFVARTRNWLVAGSTKTSPCSPVK